MKLDSPATPTPPSKPDGELPPQKNKEGPVKPVEGQKYLPEGTRFSSAGKPLKDRTVSKNPVKRLFMNIKSRLSHKKKTSAVNAGTGKTNHKSIMLSKGSRREHVTETLMREWAGINLGALSKKEVKDIESLNSSAMMAFSRLLEQDYSLSTVTVPNCLICSDSGQGSQFSEYAQALLSKVMRKYPDLKTKIEQSEGLFKTPIMIAAKSENELMAAEKLENIKARGLGKKKYWLLPTGRYGRVYQCFCDHVVYPEGYNRQEANS